jgi:sugar lactone lactonase YvrE
MEHRAEVAVEATADLGEGPVWDDGHDLLAWVDILSGVVHLSDIDRGIDREIAIGTTVSAIALGPSRLYLLALADGICWLDPNTGLLTQRVRFVPPGTRLNDGGVDAAGRFWVGSMEMDGRPGIASLFRYEAGLGVAVVQDGVGISNGIDWAPSNTRMYYVDSLTHRIDHFTYDLETGQIGERQPFVVIPPDDGLPDGLTVDGDGCVWVALWGGGQVRRYSPEGELVERVLLPVSQPTSCAFGGPQLDRIYITTARMGLTETELDDQPLAGSVFVARPGAKGVRSKRADPTLLE